MQAVVDAWSLSLRTFAPRALGRVTVETIGAPTAKWALKPEASVLSFGNSN